ncbi:MAG TPA: hypothetical protein VMU20_09330 [Candidatus Dormibacteraeota bacterium]|nr:hypothetical protein [Candidatus Dormibacteraeota bacterium]
MRAEPPPPPRRRDRESEPSQESRRRPVAPRQRCPYLEQIIREKAGPFKLLTRFKADCHVDRRTHTWTGRHPLPPCIGDPQTCALYRRERATEDQRIQRYRD